MRGPHGCTICLPGAAFWIPLPPDATDRQRIAALCNHVMQFHHGGPVDAWNEARLVYPLAARDWEQEIVATGSSATDGVPMPEELMGASVGPVFVVLASAFPTEEAARSALPADLAGLPYRGVCAISSPQRPLVHVFSTASLGVLSEAGMVLHQERPDPT